MCVFHTESILVNASLIFSREREAERDREMQRQRETEKTEEMHTERLKGEKNFDEQRITIVWEGSGKRPNLNLGQGPRAD